MLVSKKLLGRYIDLSDISTELLATTLTNAGLEVEGIEPLLHGTNLVVGYVLECDPHPDSDHLNICQVDLGSHVEQIVCGASNIAKGLTVCVATVGAELPGDFVIKETKVRGVQSNGMICSLNELGVAEKFQTESQKTGIVVLPKANPGSDPAVALGLDDEVLDISQTPNRSDFMSIYSVAFEVAALFDRSVVLPVIEDYAQIGTDTHLFVDSKTENSPLFLGKVIDNITIKDSPSWIRQALIASDIKPINNVVDISNLVMLETGHPMHFYDIDFLENQSLTVRDDISQSVEALDGHEYKLIEGDLVIMNGDNPVGIAGIMGLGNSMIHKDSKGLVMEVARFNHVSVRKTATRLGLSTESSQRYTKPMDNMSSFVAMNRAVSLLIEYADAKGIEKTIQFGTVNLDPISVSIHTDLVNKRLGTELSDDVIVDVFRRLNFKPTIKESIIECTIPSYRKDISIEEDLIEEVIRIVGYDVLEESLPLMDLTLGNLNDRQLKERLIEKTMLGLGADQILSYTLVDFEKTTGSEALDNPIVLANPISDKRAYLRTHLLPSMLEVVSYNNAHKISDTLFFEHSAIYTKDETTHRLGIISHGNPIKSNWTHKSSPLSFFDIKGMLQHLLDKVGIAEKRIQYVSRNVDETVYNKFQAAEIMFDRKHLGTIGVLHPRYSDAYDLENVVYAEIDLDLLLGAKSGTIKAQSISKYPIVTRDLALLCDNEVTASDLVQAIEKSSRRFLVDLNIFDVFTSEKLGNKKSIGIKLSFGGDHTLEVEEINDIMKGIIAELIKKFNVEVR